MTPDPAAWQAFGGVVAVIVFLAGAYGALRRLGIVGAPSEAEQANPGYDVRLATLEHEHTEFRLFVSENYVRRDDYITSQSRVIGLLETHSVTLARLEERIGAMR